MLKRWMLGSVAFAVLALGLLVGSVPGSAQEKKSDKKSEKKGDAKFVSTKQIMKICFDEEEGLLEVLTTMAKEKEPKWDKISEKTGAWVKAAEDLGKNKPKKGTAESWEKLTKKFVDDAKALDTAAGKKEAEKLLAALKPLETSCKGCHPSHK
jgi:cytochrome c556